MIGMQREKIREERGRERRFEAKDASMGKKSKITRDRDQRLFNQEKGRDSGFANDDQFNLYEKGLFTAQPTLLTLYKPEKDTDEEMYGNADERLDELKNTERFRPDKGFTGASSERSGKREREEQDPFGLERFVSAAAVRGMYLEVLDEPRSISNVVIVKSLKLA